jgi:hypothetical protein
VKLPTRCSSCHDGVGMARGSALAHGREGGGEGRGPRLGNGGGGDEGRKERAQAWLRGMSDTWKKGPIRRKGGGEGRDAREGG